MPRCGGRTTRAATLENHSGREEIQEALATGEGSGSRVSATLMCRTVYCAQRLADGTVLRISADQVTILALLFWMFQALLLLIAIAVVTSWVLADKLSRQVVNPSMPWIWMIPSPTISTRSCSPSCGASTTRTNSSPSR